MANVLCATGCSNTLAQFPNFVSSLCAPQTNAGQIESIYLGIPGNPFTDVESAAEWNARIASTTATKIVELPVIGDKPKPTATFLDISKGRKIKTESDHVLNWRTDETSEENHEAFRQLECGGQYTIWYVTSGGIVFGGNPGILVSIDAGMVIPEDRKGLMVWSGTMNWSAKFTEERATFPLA